MINLNKEGEPRLEDGDSNVRGKYVEMGREGSGGKVISDLIASMRKDILKRDIQLERCRREIEDKEKAVCTLFASVCSFKNIVERQIEAIRVKFNEKTRILEEKTDLLDCTWKIVGSRFFSMRNIVGVYRNQIEELEQNNMRLQKENEGLKAILDKNENSSKSTQVEIHHLRNQCRENDDSISKLEKIIRDHQLNDQQSKEIIKKHEDNKKRYEEALSKYEKEFIVLEDKVQNYEVKIKGFGLQNKQYEERIKQYVSELNRKEDLIKEEAEKLKLQIEKTNQVEQREIMLVDKVKTLEEARIVLVQKLKQASEQGSTERESYVRSLKLLTRNLKGVKYDIEELKDMRIDMERCLHLYSDRIMRYMRSLDQSKLNYIDDNNILRYKYSQQAQKLNSMIHLAQEKPVSPNVPTTEFTIGQLNHRVSQLPPPKYSQSQPFRLPKTESKLKEVENKYKNELEDILK